MNSLKKSSFIVLVFWVAFLLTGCQPVAQLYNGNVYKNAKMSPLNVSETTTVTEETFELKTSFNYSTSGTMLSISGTVVMGTHYQLMYDRIKVFDLFLFFLDDSDVVIDGTRLYHAFSAFSYETFSFEQDVTVPAGATKIAMGYEATFNSTDSDGSTGGGDWIYRLPLSSRK